MKLPYKVLSTAAVAGIATAFLAPVASQAAEAPQEQGIQSIVVQVGDKEVVVSLADYAKAIALKDKSPMYNYLVNGQANPNLVGFQGNDKYVGLTELAKQFALANNDLYKALEASAPLSNDAIKGYQELVSMNDDGTPNLKPITPVKEGVAVESVMAINKTTVQVTLKEAPKEAPTADQFAVTVNGKEVAAPTAVVKDANDVTGKTFKLVIATLDKQAGEVAVNGVAGTFDYQAPSISGVKALNNKQIEVTFSEKVDKTTAETVTNYGLYPMGAAGATLTTLTADNGATAASGEIKALAKQTADNKVVITLGSINSDVNGFVLNGLTNGEYLLYVNNVTDASTNKNVIVGQSNKQFTGTTTPDSTPAQVLNAAYNTGNGQLAIGFDKTVKVDKAFTDASKIKLTNGKDSVVLTADDVDAMTTSGATAQGTNVVDTGVIVPLTTATKAKVDALGVSNLSVVLEEGAFKDATNGNNSAAVTKELKLSLSPIVNSAEYNEETNVLKLNFNMDIDVAKIASLSGINVGGQSIGSKATVKTETNGTVVEIQLDAAQAAAMESAAGLNANTVVKTAVKVPAGLFTKVGATKEDPGTNAEANLVDQKVVQDATAPTVTATVTDLGGDGNGVGTGTLTITGSEELSTTIVPTGITFYAADDLKTPLGSLATDTTIARVGTSNSYKLNLATNNAGLADKINTNKAKGIVAVISKGAIKDANLTDIEAVTTEAPIKVSIAEATYGETPDTIAVAPVSGNLVNVTVKKTAADVQLDQQSVKDAKYVFTSVANPNVKVNATASYVWNETAATGTLHVVPETTLGQGAWTLTVSGLKTNAGVKVDEATTGTTDNDFVKDVAIATDSTAPTFTAGSTKLIDSNNSGKVDAGDKITLAFSEPMKLTNAKASDLSVDTAGHTLGSAGLSIDPANPAVLVITLASDSVVDLGDKITVKSVDSITDLAGNKLDTAAESDALAKPSTVKAPSFKNAVYADTNKDGKVSKGDVLTIKFDQAVQKDTDAADLKDDVTVGTTTFSNAELNGDTLTLTVDTVGALAVGSTLNVNPDTGNVNIINSWKDKLADADGVELTSEDKANPTVQSVTVGTEGTAKYLYVKMSEAVNVAGDATFADAFEAVLGTADIAGTNALSVDEADPTVIKVALGANDVVTPGLAQINVALKPTANKVLDASGNNIVKSQANAYTVTQK